MHTFNYDAFIQKATADVGKLASNQPGAVNLVPGMPGMGLFASITWACEAMKAQGGVNPRIASLDEVVEHPGALVSDARLQPISKDHQLVVIDAVGQHLSEERLKALASTLQKTREHASVWVIGGDTNAIAQALGGEATRFHIRARPRKAQAAAQEQHNPSRGPKI